MFLFHNKIVNNKQYYGSLPLYLRYTYSKETAYTKFISDKSINLLEDTLKEHFDGNVSRMRSDPFFNELLVYYELTNIRTEYIEGVSRPIPAEYYISDVLIDEVECAKVCMYISKFPSFTEDFYEYLSFYRKSDIACNLYFINYDVFFDDAEEFGKAIEFLLSNLDEINYLSTLHNIANLITINGELVGMGKELGKVLSIHDVTKLLLTITVGDNSRFYNEFVTGDFWIHQIVNGSNYATSDLISVCDKIDDDTLNNSIKKLKASMILKGLTVSCNNA